MTTARDYLESAIRSAEASIEEMKSALAQLDEAKDSLRHVTGNLDSDDDRVDEAKALIG